LRSASCRRCRSDRRAGGKLVAAFPALVAQGPEAFGVLGVVGVDGHLGLQDGVQQLAGLQVELAVADVPAAAVAAAAEGDFPMGVAVVAGLLEPAGQQRVGQQLQRPRQLRGGQVGGEQQAAGFELGQVHPRPLGDLGQRRGELLQPRVVVVKSAEGLADHVADAVAQGRVDDRPFRQPVDRPVGPVDVRPQLVQGQGEGAGGADRQPPGAHVPGQLREPAQPAGQRELPAVQAGALLLDPRRRTGSAVQGVELARRQPAPARQEGPPAPAHPPRRSPAPAAAPPGTAGWRRRRGRRSSSPLSPSAVIERVSYVA
jgi:hypothetical protein